MTQPLYVVFVWHMHQPETRDLSNNVSPLPWVRLHAARHYRKMTDLASAVPGVRVTFNVTPCLASQLAALEHGPPDDWQTLAEQDSWTATQTEFVRRHFVPHHLAAASADLPAYAAVAERAAADGPWSHEATRRLCALFALHWIDPARRDEADAQWAQSATCDVAHGTAARLHRRQRELGATVLQAYRLLAEQGKAELATSPFYHPILPLLDDPRQAHEATPDLVLPARYQGAGDDAGWQLEAAVRAHQACFGRPPAGLWPSELAAGPDLPRHLPASIRWLVLDEGLIARCQAAPVPAAADPRHSPYRLTTSDTPPRDVAVFFRDRAISDRIGFQYADWDARAAAADFVAYATAAAERAAGAGIAPAVLTVALDGENPWERFPDGGAQLLLSMYKGVAEAPQLAFATPSDVLALASATQLPRVHRLAAGSWIRGDLTTWIGHPGQNAAWDALADARRRLVASGADPSAALSDAATAADRDTWRAWRSLWAAEGSDWLWWLGPEHPTREAPVFAGIFQTHLARATMAAPTEQ